MLTTQRNLSYVQDLPYGTDPAVIAHALTTGQKLLVTLPQSPPSFAECCKEFVRRVRPLAWDENPITQYSFDPHRPVSDISKQVSYLIKYMRPHISDYADQLDEWERDMVLEGQLLGEITGNPGSLRLKASVLPNLSVEEKPTKPHLDIGSEENIRLHKSYLTCGFEYALPGDIVGYADERKFDPVLREGYSRIPLPAFSPIIFRGSKLPHWSPAGVGPRMFITWDAVFYGADLLK